MTSDADLISASFELAAEHCEDLTPLVYERLFRDYPETASMFRREENNLVKGSMLAMAIEAILDFVGEQRQSFRMIECEVLSHEAYGTSPELFGVFFRVVADTMHEVLGTQWSPAIDAAWTRALAELDRYVKNSRHSVKAIARDH